MILAFRSEYQLPCLLRQTVKNYAFLSGHIALNIRNCCSSHRHMGLLSQQAKMDCCPSKGMRDWHPPQLVENCHTFNKPLRLQSQWQVSSFERPLTLTLFGMEGGGHAPQNVLTTVPERVGGGN